MWLLRRVLTGEPATSLGGLIVRAALLPAKRAGAQLANPELSQFSRLARFPDTPGCGRLVQIHGRLRLTGLPVGPNDQGFG
jgi:hypothetical protein